jgi:hypothetical protein
MRREKVVMGKGFTVRRGTIRDAAGIAAMFDAYRVFYRKGSDPGLARKMGCARMDLSTEKTNRGAQKLYAGKRFTRNTGFWHYSRSIAPAGR